MIAGNSTHLPPVVIWHNLRIVIKPPRLISYRSRIIILVERILVGIAILLGFKPPTPGYSAHEILIARLGTARSSIAAGILEFTIGIEP